MEAVRVCRRQLFSHATALTSHSTVPVHGARSLLPKSTHAVQRHGWQVTRCRNGLFERKETAKAVSVRSPQSAESSGGLQGDRVQAQDVGDTEAKDLPLPWCFWRDDEVCMASAKSPNFVLTVHSEIQSHRAALRSLGYQVADKSYAFPGDEVDQAEKAHDQHQEARRTNLSGATTAGMPSPSLHSWLSLTA